MATNAIQMSIRRLQHYEFPEDEPEYKEGGRCAKCCDTLLAGLLPGCIRLKEIVETCCFTRFIYCASLYASVADFISDIAAIAVFWENGHMVFAISSIVCLYVSSRFGVYRYARKTGRCGFSHIPRMILSIDGILLALIPFVSPLLETNLSSKFKASRRTRRWISGGASRYYRPVSCYEMLWLVYYCIKVEIICVVGSFFYWFLVFWEITRLIPSYWRGLSKGYMRPPEFIIIALVEAFEVFPMLIIQIIAFNQDTFSMDRTVFHISVVFSILGLFKATLTFAYYYKRLVAGIEEIDTITSTGKMTINRGKFWGKADLKSEVSICPYIQGDVSKVKTLNLAESQNLEIDTIPTLPNLTKLQLKNCGLLTFGHKVWAERFPKLTELDCRSNSALSANPFPSLPQLKKLCLRDTGVSLLPLLLGNQVPKLEELDLSENSRLEIEALPPLSSLKKLTIQKHHVSSRDSSIKQEMRRNFIVPRDWGHCFLGLRTLILDENPVDVDSIPNFPILTMLSLIDCNLHNLGSNARTLKERLPFLQVLYLTKNPIDIQHVTTLPVLQELALDYTDQTSLDLNPETWFRMFPELSTLGLSGNPRLSDLSQLNDPIKYGHLKVLRLGSTGDENGCTLDKEASDHVDIR